MGHYRMYGMNSPKVKYSLLILSTESRVEEFKLEDIKRKKKTVRTKKKKMLKRSQMRENTKMRSSFVAPEKEVCEVTNFSPV